MNIKKVVCSLWLITGLSLGTWCVEAIATARYRNVVVASLMGLAFAVFAALGAALSFMGRRGGPLLLKGVAALAILYALTFVLFGGFADRGLLYAVIVAALAVLAIATFIGLRPNVQNGA